MYKKLTITVEEEIYEGLHRVIGRGAISQFIAELVRPHVVRADLDDAYAAMAADETREREAHEWAEDLGADGIGDDESGKGAGAAPRTRATRKRSTRSRR